MLSEKEIGKNFSKESGEICHISPYDDLVRIIFEYKIRMVIESFNQYSNRKDNGSLDDVLDVCVYKYYDSERSVYELERK